MSETENKKNTNVGFGDSKVVLSPFEIALNVIESYKNISSYFVVRPHFGSFEEVENSISKELDGAIEKIERRFSNLENDNRFSELKALKRNIGSIMFHGDYQSALESLNVYRAERLKFLSKRIRGEQESLVKYSEDADKNMQTMVAVNSILNGLKEELKILSDSWIEIPKIAQSYCLGSIFLRLEKLRGLIFNTEDLEDVDLLRVNKQEKVKNKHMLVWLLYEAALYRCGADENLSKMAARILNNYGLGAGHTLRNFPRHRPTADERDFVLDLYSEKLTQEQIEAIRSLAL